MPCYDGMGSGPTWGDIDLAVKRAMAERRHNSDLAEMLCWVMSNNVGLMTYPELDKWWAEHQARDRLKESAG